MLAYPHMLVEPASKAGIKVPADVENYEPSEFPHFAVFCKMQLGQAMPRPDVHWDNATVVAALSDTEIMEIDGPSLVKRGFDIGLPLA